MMHEASMHPANSFLTLTYAPEHLPDHSSLDRSAVPRFMKRLRKAIDEPVRYFHCGEYGEQLGRPHYHVCLFGYGFPDRVSSAQSGRHPLYRSSLLGDLWPYGHHQIGQLTFESAAYTARYVTKKVSGEAARHHYTRIDETSGEVIDIEPEYATMSNRPGIGHDWFMRYWRDVYPADQVISRGRPSKPPRYYDQLLERMDPDLYRQVKEARAERADPSEDEWDRLRARRICAEARINLHTTRDYESSQAVRRP